MVEARERILGSMEKEIARLTSAGRVWKRARSRTKGNKTKIEGEKREKVN